MIEFNQASDVLDLAIEDISEANSAISEITIIACGNQSSSEAELHKDVIDTRVIQFLSLILRMFEQMGKPITSYKINQYSNVCNKSDNSIVTHVSLMTLKQGDRKIPVRSVASFVSGFANVDEISDESLKRIIKDNLSVRPSKSGQLSSIVLKLTHGKKIKLDFKVDFTNAENNYNRIILDQKGLVYLDQKIIGNQLAFKDKSESSLILDQAANIASSLSADKGIKYLRNDLLGLFGCFSKGSTPAPSPAQLRNITATTNAVFS